MTYKKGIKSLKRHIESQIEFCENPQLNHGDQTKINETLKGLELAN